MYTVESLCSTSRTSYEGGSAEGAATIGSTHKHGSCTGFPQHGAMGGIMLTSRETASPMTASGIHMTPYSKPSTEYKLKQRRGEFPQHGAMGGIMLTSRETASPMTASGIHMTPYSKPSIEYKTKQRRGE
ncbi:uncharacterized protein LOC126299144 [Schistocerca gregaria]|uniref:uncharacterized protein LOC126299144 n=1 Tax=Schistocerca gregaria TaxID=7010 RepID=UPI00211DBC8C|nr:uncharacterized protein LOC126299144 [Schistocerca gregaria]